MEREILSIGQMISSLPLTKIVRKPDRYDHDTTLSLFYRKTRNTRESSLLYVQICKNRVMNDDYRRLKFTV